MSFRWYVYYCCLFGGCAAYVGWALGRIPDFQHTVWQASVRGLFLGMTLAIVLTLVDALWHRAGRVELEVSLRIFVAGFVGGLGGFAGGLLGQILYYHTQQGLFLVLGWTFTGVLIGAAVGLYDLLARFARDQDILGARRKLTNGLLGGALGGFAGGIVFLLGATFWDSLLGGRADAFWSPSATGFVALGMLIGLFIGLAQVILKTAWITVVSGFRPGRELLLSRSETSIGRAEGSDVPLYGDSSVDRNHARILLDEGRYLLEDLDSTGGTRINGKPIDRPTLLRSGDLIEIGRSSLRFGERVKRVE